MKVAKKGADVQVIEIRCDEIGATAIEMCSDEGDELGQIALVGAHGVRRRVLIQAQMIEKVRQLIFH